MKLRSTLFVLPVLAAAALWATEAPRTITIGGFLADEAGAPLEGAYAFRVDLYASTGDTALETADTTATLTAGTFNLVVPASDSVLAQEEIRYRLWADVDRDGLTETDRFPDVFKLAPVARAHRSEPEVLLRPVGVEKRGMPGAKVTIAAMTFPANGVRFNTLSVSDAYAGPDGPHSDSSFQMGVYNSAGDLVVKSPALFLPAGSPNHEGVFQAVVPEQVLPGGLYYLGATTSLYAGLVQTIAFRATGPSFPEGARTLLSNPNVNLPAHIDNIASHTADIAPAVTLEYLESARTVPWGSYRWSDQADPSVWTPTSETFY